MSWRKIPTPQNTTWCVLLQSLLISILTWCVLLQSLSDFHLDLTSQSSRCWQAAFSCHFSGVRWVSASGTGKRRLQGSQPADAQIKMRGHLVSPAGCKAASWQGFLKWGAGRGPGDHTPCLENPGGSWGQGKLPDVKGCSAKGNFQTWFSGVQGVPMRSFQIGLSPQHHSQSEWFSG